ncbi:MAG TPA: UDP-N-acetylmuramoyl-L-alanine--D-glutamate ligase [Opitutaceae bacterium]|jgi:UDP-N-acetylmuramoylalanine--D-glutamate ligase
MPTSTPDFLASRLARPVAVMGGAVSGKGAVALISSLGSESVVYDRSALEFTASSARGHDLVVFSPGFSLHHPWLEAARKAGCICMAEMDFASLFWRGRVVAVTGTNGKTTLTEFLSHALRSAGRRAVAAGNIGTPFTQVVANEKGGSPETTAVCEVSSFQAEQLGHFWADSLLWTNFAEDHLERHGDMKAYFAAKWELVVRVPAGKIFAGTSVASHAALFGRQLPARAAVATEGQPQVPGLEGTAFASYPQRENFLLAAAWWESEGLERSALTAAARSFRLGRHRISRTALVDGTTFWNDSKGTNFHAVEAALSGFAAPVVLIAGGRSKGGDLAGFVGRIAPKVTHAVLIGETAAALGGAFDALGIPHTVCSGMEEAVRAAAAAAGGRGDVLMSPGFSSFDMFRNYEDRGEAFEKAVADLSAARV